MTANIRFATSSDGENQWELRKDFVSELIKKQNIHLLGTQEGREAQIKELCSLLPQLELIEEHREWIDERMYPSLYYDKKHFVLKKSGDIWLSETPNSLGSKSFGSMFPRLCTYAELTSNANNQSLLVVNCHLDHIDEDIRLNQIKVLINEIGKLNCENLPIVLLGDFNSGPYNSVRKAIDSSFLNLYDPWIKSKKKERSSFHKFDGVDPTGDNIRIDWILLDSSLDFSTVELLDESKNGKFPSDHFFIKASLYF